MPSAIINRGNNVLWRRQCLKSVHQYRKQNQKSHYFDKIWKNKGHVMNKVWVDSTVKPQKTSISIGHLYQKKTCWVEIRE
jgi:hypothetical protein